MYTENQIQEIYSYIALMQKTATKDERKNLDRLINHIAHVCQTLPK